MRCSGQRARSGTYSASSCSTRRVVFSKRLSMSCRANARRTARTIFACRPAGVAAFTMTSPSITSAWTSSGSSSMMSCAVLMPPSIGARTRPAHVPRPQESSCRRDLPHVRTGPAMASRDLVPGQRIVPVELVGPLRVTGIAVYGDPDLVPRDRLPAGVTELPADASRIEAVAADQLGDLVVDHQFRPGRRRLVLTRAMSRCLVIRQRLQGIVHVQPPPHDPTPGPSSALAAVFAFGAIAGVLALVCASIRGKETRNSLSKKPPTRATAATRRLLGGTAPTPSRHHDPPSPPAGPASDPSSPPPGHEHDPHTGRSPRPLSPGRGRPRQAGAG
jgi:hypothetical protein